MHLAQGESRDFRVPLAQARGVRLLSRVHWTRSRADSAPPAHYWGFGTEGPIGSGAGSGAVLAGTGPEAESRIEVSLWPRSASRFRPMQVAKNRNARIAVVRVKVSAAPRGVNSPPMEEPPPMPSAPPSERCS